MDNISDYIYIYRGGGLPHYFQKVCPLKLDITLFICMDYHILPYIMWLVAKWLLHVHISCGLFTCIHCHLILSKGYYKGDNPDTVKTNFLTI